MGVLNRGAKRKHLEDIRRFPFQGGEWILTYDSDSPEYDYKLRVASVEGSATSVQILKCQVLSKDHPNKRVGDEVTLVLDPHGEPCMGIVVPDGAVDESPRIIGYAESQQINYHLIAYLKEKDTKNYRMPIWACLLHLQEVGLLPETDDYYDSSRPQGKQKGKDYTRGSKFIRKCVGIRFKKDGVLEERGGYIVFSPTNALGQRPAGQAVAKQSAGFVEIDRNKFIEGHVLLAESGALGFNIRWK